VVVDCGAAEGFFALIALKRKAKRVHVIEPIPLFFKSLEKSFRKCEKVILHNVALGAENGHISMLVDGIRSRTSSGLHGIEAPMVRLDALLMEERVDFIKVDVEGLEEDVLKGAINLIRKWKPKMAVAVYHDENNPFRLKRLILDIRPDYNIVLRGINYKNGLPKFLYAW
jgi:FkbM family methyltransferase